MGYDSLVANALTTPVYVWQGIFNITIATLSDRMKERGYFVLFSLLCGSGAVGGFACEALLVIHVFVSRETMQAICYLCALSCPCLAMQPECPCLLLQRPPDHPLASRTQPFTLR